jgi:ureidoglycolate lyase
MERHPLGSQLFLPLGFARFLIVVAALGPSLEPENIFAFVTNGRQGVNYRAGVWHHPLLALDREADFLIVDRSPETNNCEEVVLGDDRPLQVVIDHRST